MKKTLLLIIAIVSVLQASAQEADSSNVKVLPPVTDSLSLKLNKLQHDFEFLRLDCEMQKTSSSLQILSLDISTTINSLSLYLYSNVYNQALYESYLKSYNSHNNLFNALKENIASLTIFLAFKSTELDLTESEKSLLNATYETIKSSAYKVESALEHLNATLKAYKDIR